MKKLTYTFPHIVRSILNSYTQIFFSNNKVFAVILLLVTFFDVFAGISGLTAVIVSNMVAYLIGFNRFNIKCGYYGFNSLLVGLGLGVFYQPSVEFFFLLLFASLLTLFITVMMEGVVGKYGLPYLSIPFLFGIWMVTLASREFTALTISERGIYVLNEMYSLGGISLVNIYKWFGNLNLHESIIIYFKSLGAIFFQYHLFAGMLIALGLLICSRISFLLSLVGFFSAYLYYHFIGANIHELSCSYIGFNFILTAIAVGGLFIMPSKYSFLWVILLTPLISITITSTNILFSIFQLSIYSLPFNFIVLLFLYALKFRERFYNKPEIVAVQQFSPENNLYTQLNAKARASTSVYLPFSLPFWDEWTVVQGHDGEITHQGEWKHAWDFVIKDDQHTTYKGTGVRREDYYCYNKPVIAPADGIVEDIADDVDDNEIGDVNTEQNWGNTIVIKHADFLYSKISHIKKGTFEVKKGDVIKKGDLIAYCGNSGRSPEPHIHFQIQSTPYISSKTLDYPIGHYIVRKNQGFELKSFARPEKDDVISNIRKNTILYNAFHFIPGQQLKFTIKSPDNKKEKEVHWEVITDIYNNSYIYCKTTKSKAYFKHDGSSHYFTQFVGNRKSLLFCFYLASYKVLVGFYKDLTVKDNYSLHLMNRNVLTFLQDFIAPFYIFMHSKFTAEHTHMDDYLNTSNIVLKSKTEIKLGNKTTKKLDFELFVNEKGIDKFIVIDKNRTTEAICVRE